LLAFRLIARARNSIGFRFGGSFLVACDHALITLMMEVIGSFETPVCLIDGLVDRYIR
jgi:hypothetical protein